MTTGAIRHHNYKNIKEMEKSKLVLPITILLACIILGGFYYASEVNKQQSIENRGKQNSNFTLQSECADQASRAYKNLGYPSQNDTSDNFTSHYNQKLNKCFIEIYTENLSEFGTSVYDANELKEYVYFGHLHKVGDPPALYTVCMYTNLINPNGDVNDCKWTTTFDNLLKLYMSN